MSRLGNFFRKIGRGIKKGFRAVKKVVWDKHIQIMSKVGGAVAKPITNIVKKVIPGSAPIVDKLVSANDKIRNFIAPDS